MLNDTVGDGGNVIQGGQGAMTRSAATVDDVISGPTGLIRCLWDCK
jgi:hypothetical protein